MALTSEQRLEIEKLLPFWINGTLSEEESDLVAKAIAADPEIKAEIEMLGSIQGAIQSRQIERSPGAIGLARLRRDITALRRGRVPNTRPRFRHGLLAASFVLAMLGGISIFVSQTREPIYLQASGGDPGAAFTVAFRGQATAEQISSLLLEMDLFIVDGPSALSLYRLSEKNGKNLESIADALRARADLIEYVEVNR